MRNIESLSSGAGAADICLLLDDTTPWMTVSEFAVVERVHPATARDWARTGKVPAYREGRSYRIAPRTSRLAGKRAALCAPVGAPHPETEAP